MQQSPERLLEQLRSLRLSGAERETLRASLLAKMRLPSGRQATDDFRRPILSPWSRFFEAKRFQAVFLIALIIIGGGSSAALAAEGALPGDVLYPVKTRVVEPLARLVAARSPATEAGFEATLLDRRLSEAEALDSKKTLDAPLREAVRENVRAQSARAEVAARMADKELPQSVLQAATSTTAIATSSPVRFEESQRSEHSGERDRSEKRAERVLEEHKRILERLELSDGHGGNSEHDADGEKEEHEGDH